MTKSLTILLSTLVVLIGVLGVLVYASPLRSVVAASVENTAIVFGAAVLKNSFGGKVIVSIPCTSYLGPSLWVEEDPSGPLLPPYSFIWTPLTLTNVPPSPTGPSIPPLTPGQGMLGRFDIPYFCCPPPSVPTAPYTCYIPPYIFVPPLVGLRMQNMQSSPSPQVL